MSTKDDGGPAFPLQNAAEWQYGGMSLRDYFAAKAMQGALAGHHAHHGHEDYWNPKGVAAYAYEMADAMLEARKS